MSSMFKVCRFLKIVRIMASPTAASAAATTITKNANRWPLIDLFWYENVTKLRFTAFSISSMDMNTVMTLRRNRKPATPRANKIALRVRNQEIGTWVIIGVLTPCLGHPQDRHVPDFLWGGPP